MLKRSLSFILIILCAGIVHTATAQVCDGQRYYSQIFSSYDSSSVVYSNHNDTMDIYLPHGDTATRRKAVLLIHGGNFFADGHTRGDTFMVFLCHQFALHGYVAVSIDYSVDSLTDILALEDSSTGYPLIVQSISDGKAAVRYLKRYASTLGIDSTWIVIGGEESGALIANEIAYLKGGAGITPLLDSAFAAVGGVEGNSGNPGYSTTVKSVLNYGGGLLNLSMLSNLDFEPIYSAQGDSDITIPYECGLAFNGGSDISVCGSGAMQPVLDGLGITNSLHTFYFGDQSPWQYNTAIADSVLNESLLFLYKIDCSAFTGISSVQDTKTTLYPNPATQAITIQTGSAMESVSIIDYMGRAVLARPVSGAEATLDISSLSKGIYMAKISLRDNAAVSIRTFVVE